MFEWVWVPDGAKLIWLFPIESLHGCIQGGRHVWDDTVEMAKATGFHPKLIGRMDINDVIVKKSHFQPLRGHSGGQLKAVMDDIS
jgi:hypothetical protein